MVATEWVALTLGFLLTWQPHMVPRPPLKHAIINEESGRNNYEYMSWPRDIVLEGFADNAHGPNVFLTFAIHELATTFLLSPRGCHYFKKRKIIHLSFHGRETCLECPGFWFWPGVHQVVVILAVILAEGVRIRCPLELLEAAHKISNSSISHHKKGIAEIHMGLLQYAAQHVQVR